MKNSTTKFISRSAMIAALYVALTMISAAFGLSSGIIQVRISEALCVLPIYTFAAVPGVTVGCLVSNIIYGGTVFDIALGTLATLLGSLAAYFLRKIPYISSIPTIISNTLIIPCVLILSGLGGWEMFPYFALTVGIGEVISCGVFGTLIIIYLEKHRSTKTMLFK
ncbi:MAG: QueT transporter family protein [Ruminococcaceae bacterium]|nr:QueT transporter family protein [Oscillospiraceae bacterium]